MDKTEQIVCMSVIEEGRRVTLSFNSWDKVLRNVGSQEFLNISHLINKEFKFEDLAHFELETRQKMTQCFIPLSISFLSELLPHTIKNPKYFSLDLRSICKIKKISLKSHKDSWK